MTAIKFCGVDAFYNIHDYESKLQRSMRSRQAPTPLKVYPEKKATSVGRVVSYVKIPFTLMHHGAGSLVLPASSFLKEGLWKSHDHFSSRGEWDSYKIHRFSIEVDGKHVDALLMGTEKTFKSKKWTLFSDGNGQHYLGHYYSHFTREFLTQTNSSGVFFNYPGVGASQGNASQKAAVKAHKKILEFLRDPNGLGAKKVICFGFSLGGGVLAESNPDTPQIYDRTFASIGKAAQGMLGAVFGRIARFFLWLFGWTLSPEKTVKQSDQETLIIQAGEGRNVSGDEVITKEASLGEAYVRSGLNKPNVTLITGNLEHNDCLEQKRATATKIISWANRAFDLQA